MASPPEEALGEPLFKADEEEPAGMPVSWEALPDVVRRKLCQDGKPLTPVLLWNMFMSDDEVCSFVESAGFVAGSVEWLRYSHVLCELWREAEHRAYLATRGLSSQLGAHCRAASGMQVQPPVAVGHDTGNFVGIGRSEETASLAMSSCKEACPGKERRWQSSG